MRNKSFDNDREVLYLNVIKTEMHTSLAIALQDGAKRKKKKKVEKEAIFRPSLDAIKLIKARSGRTVKMKHCLKMIHRRHTRDSLTVRRDSRYFVSYRMRIIFCIQQTQRITYRLRVGSTLGKIT